MLCLTLAAATQIADKQEEEMVTTDATLLELNERAAEVKNRIKASVKDVERLNGRACGERGRTQEDATNG